MLKNKSFIYIVIAAIIGIAAGFSVCLFALDSINQPIKNKQAEIRKAVKRSQIKRKTKADTQDQKSSSATGSKTNSDPSAKSSIGSNSSSSVSDPNSSNQQADSTKMFNSLPQKTQLALLITKMFDGKPFNNTNYQIFMGLPNAIVIYDNGEGIGGWPDHVMKFIDKHNGDWDEYAPHTTTDNADSDQFNTSWQYYQTFSDDQLIKEYYSSQQQKLAIQNIESMVDLSRNTEVFPALPN